ncbi:MAG TPA: ROK family protein [Amycolatopsis sp.]|nr:ROK family protein [Amycolatopsis sp.]
MRAEAASGVVHEVTFRWPSGEVDEDLAELATRVRALQGADAFEAVGVAMPATLDEAGRVVAWPGRPSWVGLDLARWLRVQFPGIEARCADDGDLAAVAEAHEARCANLVYFGVGTGIGGGAVVGGRPCPGFDRGSCEIGHLVVDASGPQCDCGRRGCVQAIAAGPATLRRAASARGRPVSFSELARGYPAGEPWAVTSIEESCTALAVAVVNLGELLHPERVLIGGGFGAGIPGFAATVGRFVAELSRPGRSAPPVGRAVLGGRSSLRGAMLLAQPGTLASSARAASR